jgi:hypothetical protein
MLTPSEDMMFQDLQKKSADYTPLTDAEILVIEKNVKRGFSTLSNEFLACTETWTRICDVQRAVADDNQRLLMEVRYLKKLLFGSQKKDCDQTATRPRK